MEQGDKEAEEEEKEQGRGGGGGGGGKGKGKSPRRGIRLQTLAAVSYLPRKVSNEANEEEGNNGKG